MWYRKEPSSLMSLIAQKQVTIQNGKIHRVGEDVDMGEEEEAKEPSQRNISPSQSKQGLDQSNHGDNDLNVVLGLGSENNLMDDKDSNDIDMRQDNNEPEEKQKLDPYDMIFMGIRREQNRESSDDGFGNFGEKNPNQFNIK